MHKFKIEIKLENGDYCNGCSCLDGENDYCNNFGINVSMIYKKENFGKHPRPEICKENEIKPLKT